MLAVGGVKELVAQNSGLAGWQLAPREAGLAILQSTAGVSVLDRPDEVLDDSIIAGMGPTAIFAEMDEQMIPGLVTTLVAEGVSVLGVTKINPTLEQLFLKMTEGEVIE